MLCIDCGQLIEADEDHYRTEEGLTHGDCLDEFDYDGIYGDPDRDHDAF
jgi:hypothetical protein